MDIASYAETVPEWMQAVTLYVLGLILAFYIANRFFQNIKQSAKELKKSAYIGTASAAVVVWGVQQTVLYLHAPHKAVDFVLSVVALISLLSVFSISVLIVTRSGAALYKWLVFGVGWGGGIASEEGVMLSV